MLNAYKTDDAVPLSLAELAGMEVIAGYATNAENRVSVAS